MEEERISSAREGLESVACQEHMSKKDVIDFCFLAGGSFSLNSMPLRWCRTVKSGGAAFKIVLKFR